MPFNWKEYFFLAQFLQNCCRSNFSNEATQRSSISRAYYAAFCSYRKYASSKLGFQPSKTAADHKNLRDFLQYNGKASQANILDRVRKWRDQCDYDDVVYDLQKLTTQSLSDVDQLFKNLP